LIANTNKTVSKNTCHLEEYGLEIMTGDPKMYGDWFLRNMKPLLIFLLKNEHATTCK
jgi:hypothetical protein